MVMISVLRLWSKENNEIGMPAFMVPQMLFVCAIAFTKLKEQNQTLLEMELKHLRRLLYTRFANADDMKMNSVLKTASQGTMVDDGAL